MKKFVWFVLLVSFLLVDAAPVSTICGGTGVSATVANEVVYVASSIAAFNFLTFGTSGLGLVSNGASSAPTWQNVLPGYIAGSGFGYAGTTSALNATPSRTMIISPSGSYASITNAAVDNTAFGASALNAVASNTQCTAIGSSALLVATGSNNTAVGDLSGSATVAGTDNIALGFNAHSSNVSGNFNVVIGSNNTGVSNLVSGSVAVGQDAFANSASAVGTVAFGQLALNTLSNSSANHNIALGYQALSDGTTGADRVAVGYQALQKSTGNQSVGFGGTAGSLITSGANNIYLGTSHLIGVNSASNNIVVGNAQTAAYFFGINGATSASGVNLLVNSSDLLGTTTSSAKYKKNITLVSYEIVAKLLKLSPVKFNYIKDASGEMQYGMIAEDVEEVFPETVVYATDGVIYSIQYHKYIPLLIKLVQLQHEKIAQLKNRIKSLRVQVKNLKTKSAVHCI